MGPESAVESERTITRVSASSDIRKFSSVEHHHHHHEIFSAPITNHVGITTADARRITHQSSSTATRIGLRSASRSKYATPCCEPGLENAPSHIPIDHSRLQ